MPERATVYTYPWDLTDQGIDTALDLITHGAGLNSISLAQSYHVSTYFSPHNPRRPIYWGEEGAIYFQPSEAFYSESPIKPLISEVVTSSAYMRELVGRIKARGLDCTSWLVFNYNHHLPRHYPDAAKHDPFGQLNLAQLCPASPLTRAYALALVRDVLNQFAPDEIHLESLAYLHFDYGFRNPKIAATITPLCRILMGLCYCTHCLSYARRQGLDHADALRADVAAFLADELAREPAHDDMTPPAPEALDALFSGRLRLLLNARIEAATSLMEEVTALIRQTGARVSFFGGCDPIVNGLDDARFLRDVYLVNASVAPDGIAPVRAQLPPNTGLGAIVHPSNYADAGALGDHLQALAKGDIDGFAFYNYGLLRRTHLEWIGAHRHVWT